MKVTPELLDLAEDLFNEFANAMCPKCECQIPWRDYISTGEIEKWLKEREGKDDRVSA